jgi:hypothetical protein
MGRRTRMITPTTKIPEFPVEARQTTPEQQECQWTVSDALDMLRSGYSLPRVVSRTGKNRVQLRELARANRIEIREH